MPEGLSPQLPVRHAIVFYDGDCGVCHRLVSFLVRRDHDGSRFRFAPLQGETFASVVPADARRAFADSVVLWMPDGSTYQRWQASHRMLRLLGGFWSAIAALLRLVPISLGDRIYDALAARRSRWFVTPSNSCPSLPDSLRGRFLP
ncbi:MAG: DCC1-like thiol-disulfide oxidoreductase family protein [Acidobacteriota bacterium]